MSRISLRAPLRSLMLAALALTAGAAQAQSAEAALSRFLDGVTSYRAQFTQEQTDERGLVVGESRGTMALARPGRFRWAYESPTEQLIVTDGVKLWLYDADLKQVTIRGAADALQGTPAALLSQQKTLTEAFTVQDEGEAQGIRQLKLLPRSKESDFQDVTLWLKGAAPVRMKFRDTLGGATDIRFTHPETNARLAESLFRFTPPKGVELIDSE